MRPLVVLCIAFMVSAIAKGAADPTRPVIIDNGQATSQQPVLSAIITRHSQRFAVINGQLVREGDTVGANQVKQIGRGSVRLESPEGSEILSLPPVTVKKQVVPLQAGPEQGIRE